MNYGMVAQAMMIVSMATLLPHTTSSAAVFFAELIICGFGFFYSFFQYTRIREMSDGIHFIRETYLLKGGVFKEYCDQVKPKGHIRTHTIPALLSVVWILFFVAVLAAKSTSQYVTS